MSIAGNSRRVLKPPPKRITVRNGVRDPIALIGLELEGGWNMNQLTPFVEWNKAEDCWFLPLHEDQSLQGSFASHHVGEIISPPMFLEPAIQWMRERYPREVSERCGFHVHVSFANVETYAMYMDAKFYPFFLKRWEKWYEENSKEAGPLFRQRLSGKNKYCKKLFVPEKQLMLKNKAAIMGQAPPTVGQTIAHHLPDGTLVSVEEAPWDPEPGHLRRTQLNFCWNMHKTLECRLFPMWENPDTSEKAVRELVQIYRDWWAIPRKRSDTTISEKLSIINGITKKVKNGGVEFPTEGEGTVEVVTPPPHPPQGEMHWWSGGAPIQYTGQQPVTMSPLQLGGGDVIDATHAAWVSQLIYNFNAANSGPSNE